MFGKPLRAAMYGTFWLPCEDWPAFTNLASDRKIEYKVRKVPKDLIDLIYVVNMKASDWLSLRNEIRGIK